MSTTKKRKVKILKPAKHGKVTPKIAKAAVKAVKEKREQIIKKVVITIDATKLATEQCGSLFELNIMDQLHAVMENAKIMFHAARFSDIANSPINIKDDFGTQIAKIEFKR